MAQINESHECQGCGVPSDNFTTLFFGEHIDKIEKTDFHVFRLRFDAGFVLNPKSSLNSPSSFISRNNIIQINLILVRCKRPIENFLI